MELDVMIDKLRALLGKLENIGPAVSDAVLVTTAKLQSCLNALLISRDLVTDLPGVFEELRKPDAVECVVKTIQEIQQELSALISSSGVTGAISEHLQTLRETVEKRDGEIKELKGAIEKFPELGGWILYYVAGLPDVKLRAAITDIAKLIERGKPFGEIKNIIESGGSVI